MKYMFASDIHGSACYCRKMLEIYRQSGAGRLILLGDILYHGPRNDLPEEYAPKLVTEMLNQYKDQIYAVRGNCDAEVDQMVLEFPIMADYALLELNGKTFMQAGDVLIHGHIHLPVAEKMGDKFLLNPGSTSLPKEGNPNSYAMLDGEIFTIYDFDGNKVKEIAL